jgi:hypothetical protein
MSETPPLDSGALNGRLQDVVDELSELLGAPAVLEDIDLTLLAYRSQGLDVDPVRAASILGRTASAQVKAYFESQGIRTATGPLRLAGDPAHQISPRTCLPVRQAGRTLGYLWVLEPAAGIDAGRLALAERLARQAGELLAQRRHGVLEHDRLVGELFSVDPVAAADARAALVARGELTAEAPIVVVALLTTDGSVPPTESKTSRTRVFSAQPGSPADPSAAPAALARRAARLVEGTERAGVSDPAHELAELAARRHEADCAARVALARPQLGRVLTWAELGFYRVVGQGPAAVEALLDGTPAARLRARADAELVRTALVYLDEAGHAARAAAALSVHRQTLYYRLEKIEQLSGVTLDQGEARLQLHLGLALGEVLPFLR